MSALFRFYLCGRIAAEWVINMTDWIMIAITTVYVIATIFICVFNYRSAKATREQVFEMRRQYEDKKRLEIMPYLYITVERSHMGLDDESDIMLSCKCDADDYTVIDEELTVRNIGLGVAKDIQYVWNNLDASYKRKDWPFHTLAMNETKKCIIDFMVNHAPNYKENEVSISVDLCYSDLLDNNYTQKLALIFEIAEADNVKLKKWDMSSPVLITKEKISV